MPYLSSVLRLLCSAALAAGLLWAGPALADDLPAAVATELAAARAQGIPTGALEAKAREGLAKGVPPERIAAVLTGMRIQLVRAAEVLGPQASPENLAAAAAALAAGASPGTLLLVSQLDPAVQPRAMQATADLLREGISEEDALSLVTLAARSPHPGTAFSGLATAMAALVANGMDASLAVEHVSSAVSAGLSPNAAPLSQDARPVDQLPGGAVGRQPR